MTQRKSPLGKSLAYLYPHFLAYWDYEKNDLKPEDIGAQSSKSFWWKCLKNDNHSWDAKPVSMIKQPLPNCPYCSLKRLHADNTLAVLYPRIAAEFHEKKNGIAANDVIGNVSSKKYWFKCSPAGHEWEASLGNRIRKNSNCPACYGRVAHAGNSLAALFPNVASELDVEKSGVTADMLVAGSERRVWWRCKAKGHEWETMPYTRTKFGSGCPYCSNQKINAENSLATKFPEIAKEFNVAKNGISAEEVGAGAFRYAWWKCLAQGHEWQSYVSNRTSQEMGCPKCSARFTSIIEKEFRNAFSVSGIFNHVDADPFRIAVSKDRRRYLEVDIHAVLDGQNIAIEYDGSYYHQHKEAADLRKTKQLLDLGYTVIRIREQSHSIKLPLLTFSHERFHQVTHEYKKSNTDISSTVQEVLKILGENAPSD